MNVFDLEYFTSYAEDDFVLNIECFVLCAEYDFVLNIECSVKTARHDCIQALRPNPTLTAGRSTSRKFLQFPCIQCIKLPIFKLWCSTCYKLLQLI